jgi:hypothetical protein
MLTPELRKDTCEFVRSVLHISGAFAGVDHIELRVPDEDRQTRLARIRSQPRHTRGNPETFRRRQLTSAVPLLPREIDPIGALNP